MRKDDTAVQAGLHKFIKLKNRQFIGKEICENELKNGTSRYLVKIEIDISTHLNDAHAYGDNPIFDNKINGKLCGWTTSGAYSFQSNRFLAWAYLYDGYLSGDKTLYVEIVGERRPIYVILESLPPIAK